MRLACSYFGNRFVRYVRQDMQRLRELGFTRVIHTFSENDLAYYRDTMREIVGVTREAGLEAWLDPWGVARIFGGEAFSRWTLQDDDLRQRGASGRRFDGACLNHPRLRERMAEWIAATAAGGADGVFWDEPHWTPRGPGNPDGEYCVCEHCRSRGGDLQSLTPPQRELFRADSVVGLLADLVAAATQANLASSICVLPQGMTDQPHLPWEAIAALPGLAEFGTDPYWEAFGKTDPAERDAFIDESAAAVTAAAAPADVTTMLWVQAFRIPRPAEEDLLRGVRRLAAHRPDTIAVWGFEACRHTSSLACERPDTVWQNLVALLRELASSTRR